MRSIRPFQVLLSMIRERARSHHSRLRLGPAIALVIVVLSISACSSAGSTQNSQMGQTSTTSTDTSTPLVTPTPPHPKATHTPVPTHTTVPAPTHTPGPVVKYGWYTVNLKGCIEQCTYNFQGQADLVLIPHAASHATDFCFATSDLSNVATDYAYGGIYIESNTKCYGVFGGGANGPGALAALDDGSLQAVANTDSIMVTWHPDPSHCCYLNLSPNMFDSNTVYYTDRGVITLTFYFDGTVSGSIGLGGCETAPYCAAPATYAATFSGSFTHA